MRLEDLVRIHSFLATWKELALRGRMPAGLQGSEPALEPLTPHVALIEALLAFMRAQRCARERLRSVRRWQLLYSSETTATKALPRTRSQLACLVNGNRSWSEWNFYDSSARTALADAACEFQRARAFRCLRCWRHAVDKLLSLQWCA